MPGLLQFVATINPLNSMVDGVRAALIAGTGAGITLDLSVLFVTTLVISLLSAYMYSKVGM